MKEIIWHAPHDAHFGENASSELHDKIVSDILKMFHGDSRDNSDNIVSQLFRYLFGPLDPPKGWSLGG